MSLGVSIIICCYNSAKRLPVTLEHLARQIVPADIHWEIILVDNASTDDTMQIGRKLWAGLKAPGIAFKILKESVPGKNYAFKRGLEESRFDYILTCDDDNWLEDHYVATGFQIMESDLSLGALGGTGIIEAEQPAKLTADELKKIAVHGSQHWASSHHWVYGAGSFYRKKILRLLFEKEWRQITTGRSGSKLISGEDVELCFAIYLSGYKIKADDRLMFRHFVPLKRQNLSYIFKMSYWLGYSNVLLTSYYHIINDDKQQMRTVLQNWYVASAKALIKYILFIAFQKIGRWRNLTDEQKIILKTKCGVFVSLFQNRDKIQKHHMHVKQLLMEVKTSVGHLGPDKVS